MRFATLSLTFLLTTGLLSAGLLSAQADNPDVPQTVDDPEGDASGQAPEGDPGMRPSTVQDLQSMGLHGLDVEVFQDPLRIAPGEHGHLILLVRLPKDRTAEKGGQVVMNRSQGPLKLGLPVWDPPPKGKSVYSDVIVIKVPLSIDAKAAFGKPMVQGSVRLRGDFNAMAQPGAEIAADGGQADPAAPPPGQRPNLDPNRAELKFQRLVHIGPPMPKASRGNRKAGGAKTGSPAGVKAGSVSSGESKAVGTGSSDVIDASGEARTGYSPDGETAAGATEEAPELADEKSTGFPWWILSIALGLLAVLTFLVQAKKA